MYTHIHIYIERERDINLLFHLFMHSLVASCMGPDPGSNLQPWFIRMMLLPTEPPGQSLKVIYFTHVYSFIHNPGFLKVSFLPSFNTAVSIVIFQLFNK